MSARDADPAAADAHLATLGRLTRGALHELANPLLALLGSAELALADADPGTRLYERLGTIQQTGVEISEIVRALQTYIRAGEAPVDLVPVAESARAAVALVRLASSVQDVELTIREEAEPVVRARPGPILRSVVELLLDGLGAAKRGDALELVVWERDGDALVSLAGTGEVELGTVAGGS